MNRKQAIIESATRLFAEKGFYNTSTPEIAEAAGVAHGTLFYHYTNKEGIILEIFRRAGALYLEEMEAAVAARDTGLEKLEALLRFNSAFSRSHSRQLLIFLRDFPDKLTSEHSELKSLVRDTSEKVLATIARCLETGIADNSISCADTGKTAHIINGLIFGIVHMDLLGPVQVPDLEEEVNGFCRAALTPAGPPKKKDK